MSYVSDWWAAVNEESAAIKDAITRQKLQPRDGSVYIISKKNRLQNTQAGSMSIAPARLAAQRIVLGSHELATDEQIRDYQREQAELKARLQKQELAAKRTYQISVPLAGETNG